MKRIRGGQSNIAVIAEVNALSRAFSAGEISADQVRQALERLRQEGVPGEPGEAAHWRRRCFGLRGDDGGTWLEGLVAGVVGTVVLVVVSRMERRFPRVIQAAVGAIVAAFLVATVGPYFQLNVNVTILGAVMVLAPGMVITTAIRDLLGGELVSGLSRSAEALVIAVAIATGVAVVLSLGGA